LARDYGVSVEKYLSDIPQSRASPLPQKAKADLLCMQKPPLICFNHSDWAGIPAQSKVTRREGRILLSNLKTTDIHSISSINHVPTPR
ncbi:hypothetical protein, partial [Pseudomonas kitaguniensis]|uniref:hypothetical protein n=1 Tax=Pseudomonas kitaguniensis TaxID=2607908 RepID=UPI003BA1F83B